MRKATKTLFEEVPLLEGDNLILKRIEQEDATGLEELRSNDRVYRLLPTFLYERQLDDVHKVIKSMYEGPVFTNHESLHFGIYQKKEMGFAGIIELYGYKKEIRKVSLGYRLLERCWGKGIASEAVSVLLKYLLEETDIEIITASTMVENRASAKVLKKNGFGLFALSTEEDWGYPTPTLADKWIR